MRILEWDDFVCSSYPGRERGYSGSIGSFDGVHLGHQALLRTIVERADGLDASIVITFKENPKRVLRPDRYPGDISTLSQRLERLESCGIGICVLIAYDLAFGRKSGREFLDILIDRTGLARLVMGQNARIGAHAAMDSAKAVEYAGKRGVTAEILPSLLRAEGLVSSSRIREEIGKGNLKAAEGLLGYPYELDLSGWKARMDCAVAVLEIEPKTRLLPPIGRYGVECLGDGGKWSPALMEIGDAEAILKPAIGGGLPQRLRFV